MSNKVAYKFLREGLESNYDGSKWEVGKWRKEGAPTRECEGLNASQYITDAIQYVRGEILAKVEYSGHVINSADKHTCQNMRVIEKWKWTKKMSVKFAIYAAEQVLGIFEKKYPGDYRPRKAIEAAKRYVQTGKKTGIADAADAADAAADAADAANAAAYAADAAAYAAAYAARIKILKKCADIVRKDYPKIRMV